MTEEFQDEGGQIFRDATTLMKHIALKTDLHSRIGEIESSFIDKPCTVIWRDGAWRTGVTPLYWACATGQTEAAIQLINAGADVNALNTRGDGEKLSSLYRAAKLGNDQVVKALLDNGADHKIGDACPLKYAKNENIRNIIIESVEDGSMQNQS